MTPKELKNSILQLAIEGKLVEQKKEEGTAETLYDEIQKEKQKLIEKGKVKKEKPLLEITDDEVPFEIPKSWKWVRLADICNLVTDGTHKTPHYVSKGKPFLSVKDISKGYFDLTNIKYISLSEHKELIKRCHPEKNDILICRIGTLGKAIKINIDLDFSIFVSLGLIKLINSQLADFIVYVINSGYGFHWIEKVKVGGGTHTFKINLDDLHLFPIPIPPFAEQKRIVEKIEELMPLVDRYGVLYNRLNELNKEFPKKLKNAVLQKAIEGKLVPQIKSEGNAEDLYKEIQKEKQKLIKQGKIKKEKELPEISDEEVPFEIPKSWKWCRLKNITYSVGNKANQIQAKNISEKGKYPVVSQGQKLVDGYFDDSKKLVSDLPLVMFGDHTRNVKYIDFKFIIGADGTKFLKSISFDTKYLYYWVKLIAYNLRNRGYARHFGLLCEESFPLPPLAEQKRIVEKIEEIVPNIEKLEKYNCLEI